VTAAAFPIESNLWQHPPPMDDLSSDAVEARPVSARHATHEPWWLSQLKSNGFTVATIVGGAIWISASIATLKTELAGSVQRLDSKVDSVEKSLAMRLDLTEKQLDTKVSSVAQEIEQHRHFHQTGVGASSRQVSVQGPMSIPSTVALRDPPACISRSSKRKFSCDRATNCVGPEAFAPEFFAQLLGSAKLPATASALVCDYRP
jgi:outer membrane murein-binding lipoprotein Lpp